MTRPLLPLLLLCAAACAHSAGPTQVRPEDLRRYYPLAVGNAWTYEGTLLGERELRTVQVVRERNGYYEDNQGGALTVDAYGIRDQKRYLLRGPVEPGASWTNVVSVSSVEHYRILAVGEPCSVPAGTFPACVRVEGRNRVDAQTTVVNELTFAPGVGLVRIRTFAERQGQAIPQATLSLLKYRLGS